MPPAQSSDLAAGRHAPVVLLTDKLEKPSLDDRDYRAVRLENELEVLLVHDPETDKASAALDVNVGNFSDEDGMPGMAHAVEHLLFMGTKKFPVENEYSQYLSSNSGSSNAYTASTSTNFYFEVAAKPSNDEDPSDTNPSPLLGALDRFSQFFIEPLFLPSTLDRELRAVDSENKKNLQNDIWRLSQLEKSLSNPKHPYCHFSTGNLEVLKTLPEAQGINVREKFIEFHAKHYSANRMKLVVLGREPLDVLQKWVVDLFSGIENKNLPPNRWTEEVPMRETDLGTQCFAKPVMDSRELNLVFPFIDEELLYESQPSRYIGHLLGHEGPGSIMSYVKSKGWANSLSAGAYPVCPGTPGIFDVQIRLTEEGLKHYPEIAKIFFQYVAMLRESSAQEWIFNEQKGMADVDFKFRQKTPASRFTSRTSAVMQKPIPREWLLSGQSRLRNFDASAIESAIAKIRPDSMRMVVVSRNFPGDWDQKEKWYGTEYRYEKIPADLMAELKAAIEMPKGERLPELHLPHKNNFIPNKLEVEKKEVQKPALAPRVLRNDQDARTWWKKDDTFWVPKANVVVSLKNPIIYASAENCVKARLCTELVRDALEEYSYDAELAGLEYTVSLDSRGLFLDISGYNDKLPVLLEQVAVTMRDLCIKDDRFDIVKERLTRGYQNWQLQSSYQQVGDYMSWLNAERDYLVEDMAAELQNVTVDEVRLFQKQMLSQMFIEVFAHGNMHRGDALKVTDMVESTLKPRMLPRSQWPIIRSLILPRGSNYVYKKTLKDPANVNHCIETWFYVGDRGDRQLRAKTLLVDQMIHEPAFDQLRTKEQLGYIVFSSIRTFSTTCGLRFLVQSEKTPEYLDGRIEAFLVQFGQTLEKMSQADFEGHKRSLIIKRLEKMRNLDQESSRHWGQISSEYYDFEQAHQDAAHIKPLTKVEMLEFYNTYFSPSSPTRARISVHLKARGAGELDNKIVKLLEESGAKDVPQENRQSIGLLRGHLEREKSLATETLESLISQIKEMGLSEVAQGEVPNGSTNGISAVDAAQEIVDLRHYKAGLLASSGARPVKDIAEFEESDAKLPANRPLALVDARGFCVKSSHLRPNRRHPPPDYIHTFFASELPAQLTVKTSSSKKRRLARPPPSTRQESDQASSSPSPDSILPSCEPDDDPALSFSTDTLVPRRLDPAGGPRYLHADSQPASSLPSHLQNNAATNASADYPSSAASSPCASAYAELSLESDRGGDEAGPAFVQGRSQSPFHVARRAIMNGDAELPQRSSSPLKRRASSMDPDAAPTTDATMDTDPSQIAQQEDAVRNQLPRAMSVDAPDMNGQEALMSQHVAPPPLLEQVKIIEMLLSAFADAPVQEGSVAYLVSRTWVDKALALRTGPVSTRAKTKDASLGPVDNSDIVQEIIQDSSGREFVRLIPGLGVESFELFPEDAWKLVMEWYGMKEGQRPISRTAVNTADSKQAPPNILYEFHPPVFHVHRLWSDVSTIPIEQALKARQPPPLIVARSATAHAQTFLKEIKTLAGVAVERKVRIFSVPLGVQVTDQESEPPSALTPPDSPGRAQSGTSNSSIWPTLLVDIAAFSEVRETRISVPLIDHTANDKFNGSTTLQHYDLTTDQTLVLDEAIGNAHVSNYSGRPKAGDKSMPSRLAASALSSNTPSNRSSPGLDGPMTRSRAQKKRRGRSTGAVGLHNLGNTCYMNSALQCVRSVEELTKYFLTESYVNEINKDNVLGFEGRVAIAYGNLLREIYEEGRGSVTPRDFKSTVGRCRPTFSGWSQQDSQEFLGFLLDALQEDLSRIKKKPYIEKPDSTDDMINNPAAIKEMADKVWDITCRRDDSVIADLFTGLYKSTLKCPECGKISITFDPFNNLTLPLPMENMWSKSVKFFPLNDVPVKIEVELSRHSSIESLKQFISDRTGVPLERLMGAEEFKDRFFKIYDNTQDVSEEIQSSDTPTIHELEAVPTNWPSKRPQKKYRSMLDIDSVPEPATWDEKECDTMVVPVLHRRPQFAGRAPEGIAPPHFITLTREEASSYETIQRKILQRIATFSSWSKLKDVQEPDASDGAEGDLVFATASDADSSGDGKIVSKSVEGEDDMVDITMQDAVDGITQPATTTTSSKILKQFTTQAPKFIDSKNFLNPELQNLFELCYFRNDADGTVPTGWSSVDNTRALPKLADRIIESNAKDGEGASPDSSNSAGSGNDESGEEEDTTPEPSQTRMMEESSEEDAQPAPKQFNGRPSKQHPKFGPGGRKQPKGYKKYAKKANKRREKQGRGANKLAQRAGAVPPQAMPPAVADGGPLIRIFEGIVVDWNEKAWETVFGNYSRRPDPAQGARTFVDLETLHDPALKATQKRRATRRKDGITLEECLDEFERAEILSEQDMWYCPRCKEHRRASKKFDLWKTPDILVAHLKRFSSSGWRRDKLDVLVDFPIEGLDLTSRVIQKEDGKEEVYDLIGVDDHYGGLGGGHYTAYARNFVDGKWYNYNDSSVHVVSDPTTVITSAAYLLFYRRRSNSPLGGPRFKEIFDRFENEGEHSGNEDAESGDDATHRSVRTRATALTGLGDEDELPDYDGNTLRRSIEDDGIEMTGNYNRGGGRSLDMTQGWSFNGLNDDRADNNSADAGCGSDDAQFESSGDDRGRGLSQQDTDMASTEPFEDGVLSVPADKAEEGSSEEVTEIHLDGDRAARSE